MKEKDKGQLNDSRLNNRLSPVSYDHEALIVSVKPLRPMMHPSPTRVCVCMCLCTCVACQSFTPAAELCCSYHSASFTVAITLHLSLCSPVKARVGGQAAFSFSQICESELQCMSGRIFSSGMLEPESVFPQLLSTTA